MREKEFSPVEFSFSFEEKCIQITTWEPQNKNNSLTLQKQNTIKIKIEIEIEIQIAKGREIELEKYLWMLDVLIIDYNNDNKQQPLDTIQFCTPTPTYSTTNTHQYRCHQQH